MRRRGLYVDGKFYDSLFSAAIDFEFSFSTFVKTLNSAATFPVFYNGHEIILCDWLDQFGKKSPAGGIKTGKEADK